MNNVKVNDKVVVKMRFGSVTGIVKKIEGENSDILYVESGSEIHKFFIGLDEIIKINDQFDKIIEFLNSIGKTSYDHDQIDEWQYMSIEGGFNNVCIEYRQSEFKMYTLNKERFQSALVNNTSSDPFAYAQGNTTYRKKLESVKKFILKHIY